MSDDKRWILATYNLRNKRGELESIAKSIPHRFRPYNPIPSRKADLVKFIQVSRAAYWDDPKAEKSPTPPKADLCQITASECNEWLRYLPKTEDAP